MLRILFRPNFQFGIPAAILGLFSFSSTVFADSISRFSDQKQSFDQKKFTTAGLEDFLKSQDDAGSKTLAFVVIKNDIVTDSYYSGNYTESTKSVLFSATKSILGLAIGAAFEEYGLNINDSVCTWLRPPEDQGICNATVRDVLGMASGIAWKESYLASTPDSDVLRMLFGPGALDMTQYVSNLKLAHQPGTFFNYSSGDTMLLSGILKGVTGNLSREFVKTHIFEKLEIKQPIWEQDLSGTLVGAASLFLSTDDMAKIGRMMLSKGRGTNGQVVSEEYFLQSTTPFYMSSGNHAHLKRSRSNDLHQEAYGYQWWLNSNRAEQSPGSSPALRFPNATLQTFSALGFWGQYLTVIPEEQTLVIRFGQDKTTKFDMNSAIGVIRGLTEAQRKTHTKEQQAFQLPDEDAFPIESLDLALGFTAKNYCSCLFITKQSGRTCKNAASLPGLPKVSYSKKRDNGTERIESSLLGRGKFATFTEETGCTITTSESHRTLIDF